MLFRIMITMIKSETSSINWYIELIVCTAYAALALFLYDVLFLKKKMECNSSHEQSFDEAGYARTMGEGTLNLLMPESRGKVYKWIILLCTCKVQVR